MKRIINLNVFIFLFVLILTACAEEKIEEEFESPYKGNMLTIKDEQVWTRNHEAKKIRETYSPYTSDHLNINPFFELIVREQDGKPGMVPVTIGSGYITNSLLNFSVNQKIADEYLLDWKRDIKDDDGNVYQIGWKSIFREWPDAGISDHTAKANLILLYASTTNNNYVGMMDRQRIYGTETTITCETIMYLYVNKDCQIIGVTNKGYTPGQYYYYTEHNLDIALKKGINLISRTETYGTNFNGSAYISMKVKEISSLPNKLKWVMEPDFKL